MNKISLIKETLRLLNERYPQGLYEYLYARRRAEYEKIFALVEEIDRVYKVGTVGELKAVLRDYWKLHVRCIDEFNEEAVSDTDLTEARREYEEERLQA